MTSSESVQLSISGKAGLALRAVGPALRGASWPYELWDRPYEVLAGLTSCGTGLTGGGASLTGCWPHLRAARPSKAMKQR